MYTDVIIDRLILLQEKHERLKKKKNQPHIIAEGYQLVPSLAFTHILVLMATGCSCRWRSHIGAKGYRLVLLLAFTHISVLRTTGWSHCLCHPTHWSPWHPFSASETHVCA